MDAPQVTDKDVVRSIGITFYQVGSIGFEGHVAPIAGDGWINRIAGGYLRTAGGDRDAGRLSGMAVVDEDVRHFIRIPRHQVRGVRIEGHVAPV